MMDKYLVQTQVVRYFSKGTQMDIVYTFDQHEYLLLLGLLNSQMVLGIEYPYSNPQEEQIAMEQALQSLQEKGYVARKEGKIEITPDVASLVSICASPQYILIAACSNAKEEQDARFFHFAEQGIVEDKVLSSGSRRLNAISESQQIVERLSQQFYLQEQPAVPGESCTLASSALKDIRQSTGNDEQEIASQLQQAGANALIAESLARALVAPVSNSALTRVRLGEESTAESIAFLESAEGLLEMHALEEEQVCLTPVDADTAIQMIASYVS